MTKGIDIGSAAPIRLLGIDGALNNVGVAIGTAVNGTIQIDKIWTLSSSATKIGEIIVIHCQPRKTGTAMIATPIQSTISPK